MIHRVSNFQSVPTACQGGALSIGNFDGVHRGHSRLLQEVLRMADELSGPSVVMTFDPHPIRLLKPNVAFTPIMPAELKAEIIRAVGIDHVLIVETTPLLLQLTYKQFFEQIITQNLKTRGMVEGPNFSFGKNREGTVQSLIDLCSQSGLNLHIERPHDDGGEIISSSRVRRSLLDGDVKTSAALLGRAPILIGEVISGAGRGTGLGFPTANLRCSCLIPGEGVYAGTALLNSVTHPVALNIGPNPTFDDMAHKVEAHVIGFDGDLVAQSIRISLLDKIRPTRQFDSVALLVDQIKSDVELVRQIVEQASSSQDGLSG